MAEQSKSELLIEINNLTEKLNQMQEKLYDEGIEERPSIMKQIIDREERTLDLINYSIDECEKETGRDFPYLIIHRNLCDDFKGSKITFISQNPFTAYLDKADETSNNWKKRIQTACEKEAE